jgi:Ser/Thr protein kinase RdoA (MazF antagonist)
VKDVMTTAEQFVPEGRILDVREYGSGNLNDTYLVTLDAAQERHFILQRVNTHVFPRPEWIMLNIRTFTEHVHERLRDEPTDAERRWAVPRVFPARDGQDYYLDPQGAFWRAMSYVDRSTCHQTVQSIDHAREAGYALGRFQNLISDLDIRSLRDTLPGFHVTPRYLAHYEQVVQCKDLSTASPSVAHGMRFVCERVAWASVLEDARARGELYLRPIHGDPKINNIMIDEVTGHAVSIVDLDTVKPGLVHYDVGDCLRSCCNLLGEETEHIKDVRFETDLCRAILEGYLCEANQFLTANDRRYLYDAIRLIAFELGLRFFTDHLEGDVYFKARHPEHNLMRALVQFKLTESIESQEAEIRAIIDELC